MTKIYGHRGAKGTYPENTLLSFEKAIEQGVEGLELDVHMTKDGEIVVIHDENLERTTDGSGYIKDMTLEEIKQFSAGTKRKYAHFSNYEEEVWSAERVPTLIEVLELLKPYPTELNIELKTTIEKYDGIEEKVLSIVKEYGDNRKVIYSAFHLPTILRVKKLSSDAKIAWLLSDKITLPKDQMQTLELEAFHLAKSIVLPNKSVALKLIQLMSTLNVSEANDIKQLVDFIENSNSDDIFKDLYEQIRVWTVNDPEEIKQLLELGVDTIITDYPERALLIRNEQK